LLLDEWDKVTAAAYSSCGKTYDHTNCALKSVRVRGLEQQEESTVTTAVSSPKDDERKLKTTYGKFHRRCPGSYYCFFNLYLHTMTDFYYSYSGSLTYPPCTENVDWRILQNPLYVSPAQIEQIKKLTYMHLNGKCELATVGVKLNDGCAVGVNRPLQSLSTRHELKKCDAWVPSAKTVNATGTTVTSNNATSSVKKIESN
jgi:hypothetical protein